MNIIHELASSFSIRRANSTPTAVEKTPTSQSGEFPARRARSRRRIAARADGDVNFRIALAPSLRTPLVALGYYYRGTSCTRRYAPGQLGASLFRVLLQKGSSRNWRQAGR